LVCRFTPQLTAGVWVGFDDKQNSLGKKETGARAALPIWTSFMQNALAGAPALDFANVTPLEQQVTDHPVHVDTQILRLPKMNRPLQK